MNESISEVDMLLDFDNDVEDIDDHTPVDIKPEAVLDYMKKKGIFDRLRKSISEKLEMTVGGSKCVVWLAYHLPTIILSHCLFYLMLSFRAPLSLRCT